MRNTYKNLKNRGNFQPSVDIPAGVLFTSLALNRRKKGECGMRKFRKSAKEGKGTRSIPLSPVESEGKARRVHGDIFQMRDIEKVNGQFPSLFFFPCFLRKWGVLWEWGCFSNQNQDKI